MSVLIVTVEDDIHAILVKLALEEKGIHCDLLYTANMGSSLSGNVYISDKNFSWEKIEHANVIDDRYNTVWWRRPRKSSLFEFTHNDDKPFILRENNFFHESIPGLFNSDVWWVNPIESHFFISSKIVQLKLARKVGFSVPETLVSNTPETIKEFIRDSKGNSIYKPFVGNNWNENGVSKGIYTSKVTLQDLPSDRLLKVVPGIYQHCISKQYELRITCFGSYISAVKIDSQQEQDGILDWRKMRSFDNSLESVDLPEDISEKLRLIMKELKIVFGCFDFIVTPNNEYVFLEVNEQGQFLWIEDILPEVAYLDIFSDFLIHRNFDYPAGAGGKNISTHRFEKKAQNLLNQAIENKRNYLSTRVK